MNLDKESYKIDEKLKKAYINSFNKVSDEIYYLIIIATKILRYDFEKRTVEADIDRLYDEFIYFKYYSEMSKDYLLNFFMPLILASRNFEGYESTVKDLSEKLCKFYGFESKKYEYTIDVFCYDIIIRNLLIGNKDMLDILNKIKDEIIDFNPYKESKIDNVKFQMAKIKYIELIHKCIDSYEIEENYGVYESSIEIIDILQYVFNEDSFATYSKKDDSGCKSVYNLLSAFVKDLEIIDNSKENLEEVYYINMKSNIYKDFIKAMANHLLRVRYGKVSIGKYNLKSSPKDFLKRVLGEAFSDPILSMVKVQSREVVDENSERKIVLKLSTKTGEYKFEYKIIDNS